MLGRLASRRRLLEFRQAFRGIAQVKEIPSCHPSNQSAVIPLLQPTQNLHGRWRFVSAMNAGSQSFSTALNYEKAKKEVKEPKGPRLNERISAEFIRLVSDEGHCVISRRDALDRARRLSLDLVEVDRNAKPPVCKLMDFNKEKYKQQIKEKERTKSKIELRKGGCKDVRFAGKIKLNDLKIKADMVKRLIERGYRVKCMAMATANSKEEEDLGELLSRLSNLIEDICIVESGPKVEKKQAFMVVRHVKFGPTKKGSGKKASIATESTNDKIHTTAAPLLEIDSLAENAVDYGQDFEEVVSGSEIEDESDSEEIGDEDVNKNKSGWTMSEPNDYIHSTFDVSRSSGHHESRVVPEMSEFASPRNSSLSGSIDNSVETGNRYKRQQRNASIPSRSDIDFPGVRQRMRLEPQITNSGMQRKSDVNLSPQERGRDFDTSSSRVPKFGAFGVPGGVDASGKQLPEEVNRYKKPNTSRNTGPLGFPPRRNLPVSNSGSTRGPSPNSNGQGRWGE